MQTVVIDKPMETVRSHWTDAETLAKFFPAVTEITPFSDTRWLWKAEIGGITKRWMTSVERQSSTIRWEPTDGSDNRGVVELEETDDGVEVRVDLEFDESIWSSKVHRSDAKDGWRARQSLEAYEDFVTEGEVRDDGFRHEPKRIELEHMTRSELYEMASERKIRGRSKMRKSQLIEALLPEVRQAA